MNPKWADWAARTHLDDLAAEMAQTAADATVHPADCRRRCCVDDLRDLSNWEDKSDD